MIDDQQYRRLTMLRVEEITGSVSPFVERGLNKKNEAHGVSEFQLGVAGKKGSE